jgi:hypothetical protein
MGATTFAAFDPKPRQLGTVLDMIAASAILQGHLVAFAASGTSWTVAPATSSLGAPVGIALNSQATTGGHVAVAAYGSVVKMMNGTDGAIDAGTTVVPSATAGMVDATTAPNSGGADCYSIGVALTGSAGSTAMYVLINGPVLTPKGAA